MTYCNSVARLFLICALFIQALAVQAVPQIEGRFIELQNTYNKAEWTTISFSQVYDEPPAVFMLSTNQGSNPAIVKIAQQHLVLKRRVKTTMTMWTITTAI